MRHSERQRASEMLLMRAVATRFLAARPCRPPVSTAAAAGARPAPTARSAIGRAINAWRPRRAQSGAPGHHARRVGSSRSSLPVRTAALLTFALLLLLADARGADDPPRMIATSVEDLERRFGIDIELAEKPFELPCAPRATGKPPGPPEMTARYVRLLARELSLYPKDFVKRARLKRIVLCADLRYSDLRDSGRPCLGLADYAPPTMYLNVCLEAFGPRYGCLAFHHEFFHLVDNADGGVADQDQSWESFNPRGFRYGQSLEGVGAAANPGGTPRGFASAYGAVDVTEDKAEVFARLVVGGTCLMKRAERDPYLRAKIIATKHALATFCPEIDERFWEKAACLERPGRRAWTTADDAAENAPPASAWVLPKN